MGHDFGMCCGTLCNKAASLEYVEKLERSAALMRQTLRQIHVAVGDSGYQLKPSELLNRIETAFEEQRSMGLAEQLATQTVFHTRSKP